ncbi:hypothetical protein PIB30_004867 [Stylosanthes scabra]|uniref:Bifunctional inhibitor/plant lipid transfer protein/seed storage helical domain-containing protein n=1 Tax=Stylosanthes scabra TaxID=79078 RepID=A0ABU6V6T4_9FABA|nr:hypothetical protein [Stylosanthes scabra]
MEGGGWYDNKRSRYSRLMMMVLMMMITIAEAQISVAYPPCAIEISSCEQYKNGKKPPNECCNPMRYVFETQLACLCEILLTPTILASVGFNSSQAIRLARSCDLNLNASYCQAALSAPPPSMPLKPKATAGADEGGAGRRVVFSGFLATIILVLCSVYLLGKP